MTMSMIRSLAASVLVATTTAMSAADAAILWQIGTTDTNNAEFALAPKGYNKFQDDALFLVGRADSKRDWPYVQPGPVDGWAGGRLHVYTIVFGVNTAPAAGDCRLILDFLDAHSSAPPHLRVEINDQAFEKNLSAGAGDASIFGEPARGKPYRWTIPFPTSLLKAGENEIRITTLSGSWVLYDALRLETPPSVAAAPVTPRSLIRAVDVRPVHQYAGERVVQPATLSVRHYGEPAEAVIRADGVEIKRVPLRAGAQQIEVGLAPLQVAAKVNFELVVNGTVIATREALVTPPRLREIWLLPHSHVDIGYTHRQDDVVKIQIGHLEKAMQLAQASATNPPGMRFKWNPEAVWTLDHFLQQATPAKRDAFIQAVRRGDVGVDGLYGNMLTGLCRPAELAECLGFGARLSNVTGVPVESAAICDVPGYTWGLVSMMGQAGVKYFAIGPNYGDRVGTIHLWDNQPFYWKSPSGQEKLLCWVVDNYHFFGDLEQNALQQTARLEKTGFPFDTTFLFWVGVWPGGGVDNAPPDEQTVEKVVAWNKKYAVPRIVIGLANEFFREFERKHGPELPQFSGDLTPYWEDGAGSTSRETALNRASADRLVQADFLWALLEPQQRSAARFDAAWKNVLLYSEHTWGAWCSISKPDDAFTKDQWAVKQAFALDADRQSRELLGDALATRGPAAAPVTALDVFNSTQWSRTDLVTVPGELALAGDRVLDEKGEEVLSQRLAAGELVFLAKDVPPFGAKRFKVAPGKGTATGSAKAAGITLTTDSLELTLDPATGAIRSLRQANVTADFVDASAAVGLNDYRYLLGTDAKGAKCNAKPTIQVSESGPLVAALRITSAAPGCSNLVREVRVVHGLDRVELINDVNRLAVREKDGVHFGFGFNVPQGLIRMETPWAVVRPNVDQLRGSCRNWFTVQRWVDVSNPDYGITWAPLDAPLMEIGGLTANLLGSVGFNEWLTNAPDSSTIYSWAQNNHWHTNYKIDQPGVTRFRYILRPHAGGYRSSEAARFGHETTRPLIASPADLERPAPASMLRVSNDDVLVESVKLSSDGKARIVHLFGVSGKDAEVKLAWNQAPRQVWMSDLTEKPLKQANDSIAVPGYGVVILRVETGP